MGAYVTHDKGRRLALVGVTERVRNTMHVAQVEQFFQFYETAKAARDANTPSADLSAGSGGNNNQRGVNEAFQPTVHLLSKCYPTGSTQQGAIGTPEETTPSNPTTDCQLIYEHR